MIDKLVERSLRPRLREALKKPYIIGLLGARQVGKTTLLTRLLPADRTLWLNFDSQELRRRVLQEEQFLLKELEALHKGPLQKQGKTLYLCIDEAQKLPEAFEIVKSLHDTFSPGLKIILSGSSSLLIKKRTAETLAGRIRFFFLHPFSLHEAGLFEETADLDVPADWFEDFICGNLTPQKAEKVNVRHRHLRKTFDPLKTQWLFWGLMPPRFHFREESEWILFLRDYLDTYVEKDMRAVERIGSLADYRNFLSLIAESAGSLVNYSKMATTLGIHRETVKEYLQVLEESLVGNHLPSYSQSAHRRVTKAEKIYLSDNGIAYYLMDLKNSEVLEASGKTGALYENLIISEFRKAASFYPAPLRFFYWRLSGPNPPEVDLVCDNRGVIVPVEIKKKNKLNEKDLRGIKTFMEIYGKKKSISIPYGALFYEGEYTYLKDERIFLLPDWFWA